MIASEVPTDCLLYGRVRYIKVIVSKFNCLSAWLPWKLFICIIKINTHRIDASQIICILFKFENNLTTGDEVAREEWSQPVKLLKLKSRWVQLENCCIFTIKKYNFRIQVINRRVLLIATKTIKHGEVVVEVSHLDVQQWFVVGRCVG